MLSKLTALGYDPPDPSGFFSGICSAISSYLIASVVVAGGSDAPPSLHTHTFTTFGSQSGLKSAIVGGAGVSGWGVDPMAEALAGGIIDFLEANAVTVGITGPGHVHSLSV